MLLQINQLTFLCLKEFSRSAVVIIIFLTAHFFSICGSFTSVMAPAKSVQKLSRSKFYGSLQDDDQSLRLFFPMRNYILRSCSEGYKEMMRINVA